MRRGDYKDYKRGRGEQTRERGWGGVKGEYPLLAQVWGICVVEM